MALAFAVQVWGASSIRCHLFLQIANFLLGHGEWDVSHAQAHENKSASWPKVMSPAQCVKVRADNKLGLRLMEAAGAGLQQLITSLFLSEGGICLMVGSSRIIGSLNVKVGITNLWGEKASCAHELFHCQVLGVYEAASCEVLSTGNDNSLGLKTGTGLSFQWYKSHAVVIVKNLQYKLREEQVSQLWLLWQINTEHHMLMLRLRLLHNGFQVFQVGGRHGPMALRITDWPWSGIFVLHCLLARINYNCLPAMPRITALPGRMIPWLPQVRQWSQRLHMCA